MLLVKNKPVKFSSLHFKWDMTNREAIAKLQGAMLATQTLGELYALMEDYSYIEVMAVYNQLPPSQQAKFNQICLRDTQTQLDAISIGVTPNQNFHTN
jgi:hypothetical protein